MRVYFGPLRDEGGQGGAGEIPLAPLRGHVDAGVFTGGFHVGGGATVGATFDALLVRVVEVVVVVGRSCLMLPSHLETPKLQLACSTNP